MSSLPGAPSPTTPIAPPVPPRLTGIEWLRDLSERNAQRQAVPDAGSYEFRQFLQSRGNRYSDQAEAFADFAGDALPIAPGESNELTSRFMTPASRRQGAMNQIARHEIARINPRSRRPFDFDAPETDVTITRGNFLKLTGLPAREIELALSESETIKDRDYYDDRREWMTRFAPGMDVDDAEYLFLASRGRNLDAPFDQAKHDQRLAQLGDRPQDRDTLDRLGRGFMKGLLYIDGTIWPSAAIAGAGRRRFILAEPTEGTAGVVGETLGGLAPFLSLIAFRGRGLPNGVRAVVVPGSTALGPASTRAFVVSRLANGKLVALDTSAAAVPLSMLIDAASAQHGRQVYEETGSEMAAIGATAIHGYLTLVLFHVAGHHFGQKAYQNMGELIARGDSQAAARALGNIGQAVGSGAGIREAELVLDMMARAAVMEEFTFLDALATIGLQTPEALLGGAIEGGLIAGGSIVAAVLNSGGFRAQQRLLPGPERPTVEPTPEAGPRPEPTPEPTTPGVGPQPSAGPTPGPTPGAAGAAPPPPGGQRQAPPRPESAPGEARRPRPAGQTEQERQAQHFADLHFEAQAFARHASDASLISQRGRWERIAAGGDGRKAEAARGMLRVIEMEFARRAGTGGPIPAQAEVNVDTPRADAEPASGRAASPESDRMATAQRAVGDAEARLAETQEVSRTANRDRASADLAAARTPGDRGAKAAAARARNVWLQATDQVATARKDLATAKNELKIAEKDVGDQTPPPEEPPAEGGAPVPAEPAGPAPTAPAAAEPTVERPVPTIRRRGRTNEAAQFQMEQTHGWEWLDLVEGRPQAFKTSQEALKRAETLIDENPARWSRIEAATTGGSFRLFGEVSPAAAQAEAAAPTAEDAQINRFIEKIEATGETLESIDAFVTENEGQGFRMRIPDKPGAFVLVTPDGDGWRATFFDETGQPTSHTGPESYRAIISHAIVLNGAHLSTATDFMPRLDVPRPPETPTTPTLPPETPDGPQTDNESFRPGETIREGTVSAATAFVPRPAPAEGAGPEGTEIRERGGEVVETPGASKYSKVAAKRELEAIRDEPGGAFGSPLDRANELLDAADEAGAVDTELSGRVSTIPGSFEGGFKLPTDSLDSLQPHHKARMIAAGWRESGDVSEQREVLGDTLEDEVIAWLIAKFSGAGGEIVSVSESILANPEFATAAQYWAGWFWLNGGQLKGSAKGVDLVPTEGLDLQPGDNWLALGVEWRIESGDFRGQTETVVASLAEVLPLSHLDVVLMDRGSLRRGTGETETPVEPVPTEDPFAAARERLDAREAFANEHEGEGFEVDRNRPGQTAIITPEAGGWRITYFDEQGPSGHFGPTTYRGVLDDGAQMGVDLSTARNFTSPPSPDAPAAAEGAVPTDSDLLEMGFTEDQLPGMDADQRIEAGRQFGFRTSAEQGRTVNERQASERDRLVGQRFFNAGSQRPSRTVVRVEEITEFDEHGNALKVRVMHPDGQTSSQPVATLESLSSRAKTLRDRGQDVTVEQMARDFDESAPPTAEPADAAGAVIESEAAEQFADQIDESLDDLLSEETTRVRENYVLNNRGLQELGQLFETELDYHDALVANLERMGFPEEFTVFRGRHRDRPEPTGQFVNVSFREGVAESFRRAVLPTPPASSDWVVDRFVVPRDAVVGVGAAAESELIVRLSDAFPRASQAPPEPTVREAAQSLSAALNMTDRVPVGEITTADRGFHASTVLGRLLHPFLGRVLPRDITQAEFDAAYDVYLETLANIAASTPALEGTDAGTGKTVDVMALAREALGPPVTPKGLVESVQEAFAIGLHLFPEGTETVAQNIDGLAEILLDEFPLTDTQRTQLEAIRDDANLIRSGQMTAEVLDAEARAMLDFEADALFAGAQVKADAGVTSVTFPEGEAAPELSAEADPAPSVAEEAWAPHRRDVEARPIFPPVKTINAKTGQPEFIPIDEGTSLVESWKAEAKRIGETEEHSGKVVISLFDITGAWSQPWADAGYTVLRYDIKSGQDLIAFTPTGEILQAHELGFDIDVVLAAPPCTSFASSGARWWKSQHDVPGMVERKYGLWATQYFDTPLDYAKQLVLTTQAIIEAANPRVYVLENPIGRIAKETGLPKPALRFDPHHYGDPYTKQTQLWGEFNTDLPYANVEPTEGSKVHRLRGDVEADKAARSETPEGFAYAFFMANHSSTQMAPPAQNVPFPLSAPPNRAVISELRSELEDSIEILRDATDMEMAPGERPIADELADREADLAELNHLETDGMREDVARVAHNSELVAPQPLKEGGSTGPMTAIPEDMGVFFSGTHSPEAAARSQASGDVGLMLNPNTNVETHIGEYRVVAVDNGAFGKGGFDPVKFRALLDLVRQAPETDVAFVVAPDVVGDPIGTRANWDEWYAELSTDFPVAFALQDGADIATLPWDTMDVLFIGGSTEYKLGEGHWMAERVAIDQEARRRGIPIHVGRVNSWRRWEVAIHGFIGRSADGNILKFGPRTNWSRVESWLNRSNHGANPFESGSRPPISDADPGTRAIDRSDPAEGITVSGATEPGGALTGRQQGLVPEAEGAITGAQRPLIDVDRDKIGGSELDEEVAADEAAKQAVADADAADVAPTMELFGGGVSQETSTALAKAIDAYQLSKPSGLGSWLEANSPEYRDVLNRSHEADSAGDSGTADELESQLRDAEAWTAANGRAPDEMPIPHDRQSPELIDNPVLTRLSLAEMPEASLRDLADAMGIETHAKAPPDQLINRIMDTQPKHPDDRVEFRHSGPPIGEAVGMAVNLARSVYDTAMDWAFVDLIERMARQEPDNLLVQTSATAMRKAVLDAKGIRGDILQTGGGRAALELVGSLFTTRIGKAVTDLQEIVFEGPGDIAGVVRWRLIAENKLPAGARPPTAEEQQVVDSINGIMDYTGQLNELAQTMQYNHATDEWRPFVTPGMHVVPRLSAPALVHGLWMGQAWKGWKPMVEWIAWRNGIEVDEVNRILNKVRDDLQEPTGEALIRRLSAELTRAFPHFPTHIKMNTGRGSFEHIAPIELITSNPFEHLQRHMSLTANRLGFIKHMGQDIPGESQTQGPTLARELAEAQLANPDSIVAVMRAIHGLPVDPRFWASEVFQGAGAPGTIIGQSIRGLGHVDRLLTTGILSGTFVPNIVEPLGSIQTLAGGAFGLDYFRVLLKYHRSPTAYRHARQQMEQLGAIEHWIRNLSLDPNAPVTSAMNLWADAGPNFITRFFWRRQELLPALIAQEAIDRMQAGQGTLTDMANMQAAMNWSPDKARAVAAGNGEVDDYMAYLRRVGAFTTNSPMLPAEQSALEHNMNFRLRTRFVRYAMMKNRNLIRYIDVLFKSFQRLEANRSGKREWQEFGVAAQQFARTILGTTLSGVGMYFLWAFLRGGLAGVEQAGKEAKADLGTFLLESWMYTQFAGPLGAMLRTERDPTRNLWENGLTLLWPIFLLKEFSQAVTGKGRYRDRAFWWEPVGDGRLNMLVNRFVPVTDSFWSALALVGFGSERQDLEQAERAYWRIRRKIAPMIASVRGDMKKSVSEELRLEAENRDEFRLFMRRASDAIVTNDHPMKWLNKALRVKGVTRKDVARRLMSLRLMKGKWGEHGTPENTALRARLTRRNEGIIRNQDRLLERWAASYRGTDFP